MKESSNSANVTLDKHDLYVVFLLAMIGAFILTITALESTRYFYSSGDDYTHYLYAITSPENLEYLFSGWGKFPFTLSLLIFLSLTEQSLEYARFLNCGYHVISVLLTYILARKLSLQKPAAILAATLVFLAPQNLELSQSILTEPFFTVIMLMTFIAYTESRYDIAFVLAGVSLLSRSEGLFIIGVLLICHYCRFGGRQTMKEGWFVLLLPSIVSVLATILFEDPLLPFFPPNYGVFQIYGHGEPLHYVLGMEKAIGLLTMILSLFGIALWVPQIRKYPPAIASFLAFGFNLILFHDIIWAFGLFGSWGTLRHLAPAAPIFAYFAGFSFQQIWDYFEAEKWDFRPKDSLEVVFGYLRIVKAASLGFLILYAGLCTTSWADIPVDTPNVAVRLSKDIADWIKAQRPDIIENSKNLYIYHPIVVAFLDLTYEDIAGGYPYPGFPMTEVIGQLQPGVVVIWDSHHGPLEGKTPLSSFDSQFQELFMRNETWYMDSEGNPVYFSIIVFQKLN